MLLIDIEKQVTLLSRAEKISQALIEVWNWKDQAYHDVEDLPIDQAIRKRLDDSLRSVRQLGMTVSEKGARRDLTRNANN